MPPTEKRGRVHTSSVSVIAYKKGEINRISKDSNEFSVEWFNGTTKAGGQFRNKTATSCRLKHIKTGLIRTSQTRSRENSYRLAMEALLKDLEELEEKKYLNNINENRNSIGKEKIRIWAFQKGLVIDTNTGSSYPIKQIVNKGVNQIWAVK